MKVSLAVLTGVAAADVHGAVGELLPADHWGGEGSKTVEGDPEEKPTRGSHQV